MKEPIRVLHVVNKMVLAGAETMIMNLYQYIDRDKVQFDFMVHEHTEGAYDTQINELGGRIFYMPKYKVINHFKYRRLWIKFLNNHPEIAIVHGHLRSTASLYLKETQRAKRLAIAHSHSTSNGTGIQAFIKAMLQSSISKSSDILMACSQEAGVWLFGPQAIQSKSLYILNNGIDLGRFEFNLKKRQTLRKKYNVSENQRLIGHIGRFDNPKNHQFLIEIVNKTVEKNPNLMYVFIGDGPLRSQIQTRIKDLEIDSNVFVVSEAKNIEDYYSAFDYFLMPSLYEGLPLTLIEAQANGLPCLISNRITTDVDKTPLISRESIDAGVEPWVDFIFRHVKVREISQYNAHSALIKAGFDVKQNAQWLESMYQRRFQEEA